MSTAAIPLTRRTFLTLASVGALAMFTGCSSSSTGTSSNATGSLDFDDAAWNYDADNDVYWQVGAIYCENPATTDYESLGIYVPGAYLTGTENDDGTYTCTVNESGAVGNWTATTAPVVMPVNTAGYSAQEAPTSYSYESVSDYLEAGFVYAYAGCRGRNNGYDNDGNLEYRGGAPWGVTDLKAAVRYLRYNQSVLPGDMDAMFTFGHSGGGAQSALMGATGDSDLYEPYFEEIGAALTDADGNAISDAVAGSMCWCPITCLDTADEAYEWMMGQYSSSGTRAEGTWGEAMSQDMAAAFAAYINEAGFEYEGNALTLEESSEGVYAAGSYYDFMQELIEESLNNFLADTEFPYTPSSSTMADGGFGGGLGGETGGAEGAPSGDLDSSELPEDMGDAPTGELPDDADANGLPSGGGPDGDTDEGELPDDVDGEVPDALDEDMAVSEGGMPRGDLTEDGSDGEGDSDSEDATTYETAQDYIDALNADEEWISYDADTNTATIASVGAFVRACKSASKDVGAFDATDRSQAENYVFGNDDNDALHFDAIMTQLLADNADAYAQLTGWDDTLPAAYEQDRALLDGLGVDMDTRAGMYNPLYYLNSYYEGAGSSTVAPHWRIRTGIEQGDTSVTVEANLALALQACDQVEDVDFATVWGQGHTTAERSGSSTANFIAWVEECMG